jgi:orotidine-5'-phosphate decarboxylase
MNSHYGLLVNTSRAVIYASGGEDFATAAARVSQDYASEMADYIAR